MFKVGDVVERTRGSHMGMIPGDVDVVVEVRNFGHTADLKKYGRGHDEYCLELSKKSLETDKGEELSYNFKVQHEELIDHTIAEGELTAENPLYILRRSDGLYCYGIHASIMRKLPLIDKDIAEVLCDIVERNNTVAMVYKGWLPKVCMSGLWEAVKNVKDAPLTKENKLQIKVTLPSM